MEIDFKWSNESGGNFRRKYRFDGRDGDSENCKRIWSFALDACGWKDRKSLRAVNENGEGVMSWSEYLKKYE